MKKSKEHIQLFRQYVLELSIEMRNLTDMIESEDYPGWKKQLEKQSKKCDALRQQLIALRTMKETNE